jgi:CxxC motif-containing protein
VKSVSGNRCAKGPIYAAEEVAGPRRVVTTTVRIQGGTVGLLPVRTARPVDRDRGRAVVVAASAVMARAPVAMGDVVLEDVAGTGVDLVATRSVPEVS